MFSFIKIKPISYHLIYLCVILALLIYSWHISMHSGKTSLLIWKEIDLAIDGAIRMLQLLEDSAQPTQSLLAAYEYALILKHWAPITEEILTKKGASVQSLEGYISSLAGGIESVCKDTYHTGTVDKIWVQEIRIRLKSLHSVLNKNIVHKSNRQVVKELNDIMY